MTRMALDADQDLSRYARQIKAAGFTDVFRYLKNTSIAEIAALHAAGLAVVPIWETTASRARAGAGAGTADGQRAVAVLTAFGAPPTVALYVTVDEDVAEAKMPQVEDYFAAFDAELWPDSQKPPLFRIGGYADGTACSALRQHGMPFCWLAGALGWDGSREFLASGKPDIVQGPTIIANTVASFEGLRFPAMPFDYDPNLVLSPDIGAWTPS